jgi:Fic family protein
MKTTWIWQQSHWPHFSWQNEIIQPLLRKLRLKQGELLGKTGSISDTSTLEAAMDTLLQNIITSSAIEGEQLNVESVRSSLAKRIGMNLEKPYPTSDRSEGLAKMILDAVSNLDIDLALPRLLLWHQWLFPSTEFSLYEIQVGKLRGEEPMQVVSGRIDKPTIHFEAPPRSELEKELDQFIAWFNQSLQNPECDPLLRAAICHFWFVTLHPFDDGNGRIARALTDLALAQAERQSIRLYAMSANILKKRVEYYKVLEKSQRGDLDISTWIFWFLTTLEESLQSSIDKIDRTLMKTRFWQNHQTQELSKEQVKVLNRLLEGGERGFENGISASQYQKVAKVSKATATRHLTDLVFKNCIEKMEGGGRSTRYRLILSLKPHTTILP